jgi:hypothetical protein
MNALSVIHPAPLPAQQFSMGEIERIATAIARGGLFGAKDPNAVLTLCLLAQAEGQHPAVVMRDYDLIQGKPAKKAEAMLRDFLTSGGRVQWNRLDDTCADATFSHPMGGEVTIVWDMDRAQRAGLAGKDMWKKFPRQMLRSRVVSEGVRTVAPMATSGLLASEEVDDFSGDASPLPSAPPAPQPKRVRDAAAAEPAKPEAAAEQETPARAQAKSWAAEHIDLALNSMSDDQLDLIIEDAKRAVAKLGREHPDLHTQVLATYEKRRVELNPPEAGDTADTGD